MKRTESRYRSAVPKLLAVVDTILEEGFMFTGSTCPDILDIRDGKRNGYISSIEGGTRHKPVTVVIATLANSRLEKLLETYNAEHAAELDALREQATMKVIETLLSPSYNL